MELNTFWRTLLRRWYFVLLALVITVLVAAFAVTSTGPTYKAEGLVLLFPPKTTVKEASRAETQGNPYLLLGGLTQARDIVIRTLTSKSAVDAFGAAHPGASYDAAPDFTTSSPIIMLTAEARTPEAAVTALKSLIDQVPLRLVDLQRGVDVEEKAYITSTTISVDTTPQVVRKGQIRVGLATVAATLALFLLLIALADGLLLARRSRHPAARPRPADRRDSDPPDPRTSEPTQPSTAMPLRAAPATAPR